MNHDAAVELAAAVELLAPGLRRLMMGRPVWRGRPSQLGFSLVLRSDDRWQDPAWPADDLGLLHVLPYACAHARLNLRIGEANGRTILELSAAKPAQRRRRSQRAGAGAAQLSLFEGAA